MAPAFDAAVEVGTLAKPLEDEMSLALLAASSSARNYDLGRFGIPSKGHGASAMIFSSRVAADSAAARVATRPTRITSLGRAEVLLKLVCCNLRIFPTFIKAYICSSADSPHHLDEVLN
jgi:hypothetical protein